MASPFEQWFSSDWQKMLNDVPDERVLSNDFSIQTASWDRRAGFLLWDLLGRPKAAWTAIYPIIREKDNTIHLPTEFEPVVQDDDDLLSGPAPVGRYDEEDLLS